MIVMVNEKEIVATDVPMDIANKLHKFWHEKKHAHIICGNVISLYL